MKHSYAGALPAVPDSVPTNIVLTQDFFPQIGGAHQWLYETYRRWPSPVTLLTRGYASNAQERAAVACFDAEDHGVLSIVRADIELGVINLTKIGTWVGFRKVVREVQSLSVKSQRTIHCLRAFPEGFTGLLCKLLRPFTTRLVVYAHGEEILVARSSGQLRLMAGAVYRYADLVVANSRNTERLVHELCPSANVSCVHPGVDIDRYSPDKSRVSDFRKRWGWPADTIVVSTVARMEPRKNQAMVIRAIAELRRHGMPLAYFCAGAGEERERLIQLVLQLQLEGWVRFPGTLTEEEKILTFCASDIHAMPSIRHGEMIEGFGIVFLEAAAAGLPSIAGAIGGQPEAVLDGKTGIVVDGSNLAEVIAAFRRLVEDASLRHEMGERAREWAKQNSWDSVAAGVLRAVAGVLSPSPGRNTRHV